MRTLILLILIPFSLLAQSYNPIYEDLKIYCAQFPDGSRYVARYERSTKNIALSEFDTEEQRLKKLIIKNNKRIKTLNKIRKKFTISQGLPKFKKIYKAIYAGRYRGDAENIRRAAKKAAKVLRKTNKEILIAIDLLKACRNGDPLPPSGISAEIREFSFIHPDFGVPYYMSGVVLKTTLPRKQSEASACVSADKAVSPVSSAYPFETTLRFTNNPCDYFSQIITRNPVFCRGVIDNKKTGTLWLKWGVTPSSIYQSSNDSRLKNLELTIDTLGSVSLRPKKKKEKCIGE